MTSTMSPGRGPPGELVTYFLRLGLLGFGGPVALVGQMERELVAERRWLSKEQMREAIAICQPLPGPLAIQVAAANSRNRRLPARTILRRRVGHMTGTKKE
jgi:chromate transporter